MVRPRSDEELLAAHAAGGTGEFDELVGRYTNELFGFLLRFVGNAGIAEDLLQDVFIQVHAAARSFDSSRRFKPWVYTIAANKARDYLRSRGRRSEHSLEANTAEGGPSFAEQIESQALSAESRLDSAEQAALVRRLVDRMPSHLREILFMGYYQQMPYADIAEVLDIPVGTVKSRLHAAVNHFSRLWHEAQEARTRSQSSS